MLRLVALVAVLAVGKPNEPDAELLSQHRGKSVDTSRTEVFANRWRRALVRGGVDREITASFGRPAISRRSQMLVVGTGEGLVLGLDLRNGQEKWRYEHTAPFETAATIVTSKRSREIAILGGRDGKLLAFEPKTGTLLWEVPLDGDMRAPPFGAEGLLVVSTSTNKVVAVEPETGAFLWSRGRPAPTGLTVMGHARATVYNGIVYAAFSDGYAEAYVLEDGRGMWSRPLSLRGGDFVDSDADPVIADGRLFVASYSDGIYALDPRDGTTLWTRNAQSVTSLGVHGKTVIAGSADGWVWGLEPTAGELQYRLKLPVGSVSRMVVAGDAAMMTAGDGMFLVLDARNGKPMQATALGGTVASEPVLAGDDVAVVSALGDIVVMKRHR